MSRKKITISVIAIVLAAAVGIRIWYVNKDVENQHIETYEMGEEAAIEDNFFYDKDYEDMSDYAVTVKGAEILSYQEFLDKYGYVEDEEYPLFDEWDMTIPEMVYDVTVVVRNVNTEENSESGFSFLSYWLISDDILLQISEPFYEIANPDLEDGMMSFKLRPGTEMEFHLPFGFQLSRVSVRKIRNSDMRLLVSIYPVQKEIRVEEKQL